MGKKSLSIFSVFVAMMLMFSVSAATETGGAGDGLNDPDMFGDAEDDGLDMGTGSDTQRNARTTGDDTATRERTQTGQQTGTTADGTRTARDVGSQVGNSNNTWENGTAGQSGNTVTRSNSQGTATRGTTVADCSEADSEAAAENWAAEGDFQLMRSQSFDTATRIDVYTYQDGNGDMAYVVVENCEVQGIVTDDSLSMMPGEGDTRSARDSNGFITVQRSINVRSTSTGDDMSETRSARSAQTGDRVMGWESIGSTSTDEEDDDTRSARDDDSTGGVNRPNYVSNSDADADEDN